MAGESPAVILYDEDGNAVSVTTGSDGVVRLNTTGKAVLNDADGDELLFLKEGKSKLAVHDFETIGLLTQILAELKKLNFVIYHAADLEVSNEDID